MAKQIFILGYLLLISLFLDAQSINKAKKLMDKYQYSNAIEILKKATEQDSLKKEAIPLLADCYRLQHDNRNAAKYYAMAVKLPDVSPENFLYYGKELQATKDYGKAREMFKIYNEKNASDPRGALFLAHCDSVLGPWKSLKPDFSVKLAENINTIASEFGPVFYKDELVYASDHVENPGQSKEYGWTGRGYLNLRKSNFTASENNSSKLDQPTDFEPKINDQYHEGPASFSRDGLILYFTRASNEKAKREGIYKTNLLKIYFAHNANGTWGEPLPFFLNSTEYSVGHPALSTDNKTLYFASDMPGGFGGTDIWMCKWENELWGAPINLGAMVNTMENEMFPSINEDGVLYFASEGHPGYGALDIFKTVTINENWSTPVNLHSPINSSTDDFAITFAPGSKQGFFSSNREGGIGSDDIYSFSKLEPVILPTYLSGVVKDKTTMLPLAGATVFIYDLNGNIKVLKTDATGVYKALVTKPTQYIVKAMSHNYIADCQQFALTELLPGSIINTPRDLLLDKLVINKTFRIDNIYYDFDKHNIREDAKTELDKLVIIMKENPIDVELGSHTDCRGSHLYNENLSQKRAESAVNYIISTGISKERITAKGYGETQLVNKCADNVKCSPEEHQANRRTEFKVTGYKEPATGQDQFNYYKYTDGKELGIEELPPDFFKNCR